MLVKDLFKRDSVECPKWLFNTYIEDDWNDSKYSFEEHIHKWKLKTSTKDVVITFDGEEYHFIAFDRTGEKLFDNVIAQEYSIFH